jgi:hypothetical protein
MEKITEVHYGKNQSDSAKEKVFEQMQNLLEFTQDHLAKTDNVISIKIKNETHTLSIQPN